jgi:hypothetical protein
MTPLKINELILETALKKLSEEFDRYIKTVESGELKKSDTMRARACLPPYCEMAFRKAK